jgi:hypothetical protein
MRSLIRLPRAAGLAALAIATTYSPAMSGMKSKQKAIEPHGQIHALAPTRSAVEPRGSITEPAGRQIRCVTRLRQLAGSGGVMEICPTGIVIRLPDGKRYCREQVCR